ncbi:MAG: ribosome assembly RNA-binding protein YhbY [Desulfuromusa sp.]|jgi:RNA-binding protein|nr:ribosome assembly RNA-binding protein YhbY [Desulfuromusa sp.]
MTLTGKQARYLRGLGHHLKPVVMVGKDEINAAIIAATDEALTIHELIKVKLQEGCLGDRKDVATELATATGSAVAQILGKNFLLYRESEEKKITLPTTR